MTTHHGICIFPGFVSGIAYVLPKTTKTTTNAAASPKKEWVAFLAAKAQVQRRLANFDDPSLIASAQRLMLDDAEFVDVMERLILKDGLAAHIAVVKVAEHFNANAHPAAADVADMANQLANALLNHAPKLHLPYPCVLFATKLLPSDLMQVKKVNANLLGLVMQGGAGFSHTAVIARTLGVPCIFQADIEFNAGINGKEVALDATQGVVYILGPV